MIYTGEVLCQFRDTEKDKRIYFSWPFCTKTLILQVALAFMGTASGSRFAAVRPRYCKESIERRESSGEANKYKGMNDVYVTHVRTHRFVYAHTHTHIYIYNIYIYIYIIRYRCCTRMQDATVAEVCLVWTEDRHLLESWNQISDPAIWEEQCKPLLDWLGAQAILPGCH